MHWFGQLGHYTTVNQAVIHGKSSCRIMHSFSRATASIINGVPPNQTLFTHFFLMVTALFIDIVPFNSRITYVSFKTKMFVYSPNLIQQSFCFKLSLGTLVAIFQKRIYVLNFYLSKLNIGIPIPHLEIQIFFGNAISNWKCQLLFGNSNFKLGIPIDFWKSN